MTIHHIIKQATQNAKHIAVVYVGDCTIMDQVDLCYYIKEKLQLGYIFYSDWIWDAFQGLIRIEAQFGAEQTALDEAVRDIIQGYVKSKQEAKAC